MEFEIFVRLVGVVLVTFILLWRDNMTKATYKRKHLVWDLASEGSRVYGHHGKSIASRAGMAL